MTFKKMSRNCRVRPPCPADKPSIFRLNRGTRNEQECCRKSNQFIEYRQSASRDSYDYYLQQQNKSRRVPYLLGKRAGSALTSAPRPKVNAAHPKASPVRKSSPRPRANALRAPPARRVPAASRPQNSTLALQLDEYLPRMSNQELYNLASQARLQQGNRQEDALLYYRSIKELKNRGLIKLNDYRKFIEEFSTDDQMPSQFTKALSLELRALRA